MNAFDLAKPKALFLTVNCTGVDLTTEFNFTFRICTPSVEYGFPCVLTSDKVSIQIPALMEINPSFKPGTYTCKLEVTSKNNFYSKVFEEQVNFVATPKIEVKMEPDKEPNPVVAQVAALTVTSIGEEDSEAIQEAKPVKKSLFKERFSSFKKVEQNEV